MTDDFKITSISFLITIFIVVVCAFVVTLVTIFQGYGNGQYVGYVTGTEVRGTVFKTNRVYMKTSLESSQEDMFCVTDASIYTVLQEHQTMQNRVTVKTMDIGFALPNECDFESTTISSVE